MCIYLGLLEIYRLRLIATWKMIRKTTNLGEKMENKLRGSHHILIFVSICFTASFCVKIFFTTTLRNFFHGRRQKARVNLTTSLNLFFIYSLKLVVLLIIFHVAIKWSYNDDKSHVGPHPIE